MTSRVPTVVVGFTDTPEGVQALRAGIQAAQMTAGQMIVVHATVDDSEVLDPQTFDEMTSALDLPVEYRHVTGGRDGADAVLTVANEVDAAFIVIGIRKRNPVGKLFLGSAAQRILLDATCPVLAVKSH